MTNTSSANPVTPQQLKTAVPTQYNVGSDSVVHEENTSSQDKEAVSCPVCACQMLPGELIIMCPRCDTPHHRDCWDYAQGCAIFGCKETTGNIQKRQTVQPMSEQHTMSQSLVVWGKLLYFDCFASAAVIVSALILLAISILLILFGPVFSLAGASAIPISTVLFYVSSFGAWLSCGALVLSLIAKGASCTLRLWYERFALDVDIIATGLLPATAMEQLTDVALPPSAVLVTNVIDTFVQGFRSYTMKMAIVSQGIFLFLALLTESNQYSESFLVLVLFVLHILLTVKVCSLLLNSACVYLKNRLDWEFTQFSVFENRLAASIKHSKGC